MEQFCPVCFGRQYRSGLTILNRHRHRESYVALVLAGTYEEAGDRGRHVVSAGQVVLHSRFEAHLNRYGSKGAEVLNIPIHGDTNTAPTISQIADPDQVVRTFEHDVHQAAELLLGSMRPVSTELLDWPDQLAADLLADPRRQIADWAQAHGFADATISRRFRKVYGVSPCAYRAQVKARIAWNSVAESHSPLSTVAIDAGFCDQAHMTRAVSAITGRSPHAWRSQLSVEVK